jgi:hypothetical protein
VSSSGGQIDWLAVGSERAGGISGVKRIGNEDGRFAGAAGHPALGGNGPEEQPFARAVEHQHFSFRVDGPRKHVPVVQPGGDRAPERLDTFVGRVAAEVGDMRGERWADKGWYRMLRLPHRQIDDRLARLDSGDQVGEPHERGAGLARRSGK